MTKLPIQIDPIKHVVVLMLENRSFDQMLGAFQSIYPDLDGIEPGGRNRQNVDEQGNVYRQEPGASRIVEFDPHHDLASVLRQIGAPDAKPGPDPRKSRWWRLFYAVWYSDIIGWLLTLLKRYFREKPAEREVMMMSAGFEGHFVKEYIRSYPDSTPDQRRQVMAYFDIDTLPALHTLARNFTICDRWFSSLPGPTWANRFFIHSGTSLGTTWMPEDASSFVDFNIFDQQTIYERLTEAKRSWRIYFHDFPQTLALSSLTTRENKQHFSPIDNFERDASGNHTDFPEFTFIEPQYMGDNANDDHPPHNTMLAQNLIARVYNAIRANEDLWNSTLLIITYDEHGGFFDHVEPPKAVCPDGYQADYGFDQLGVRVPAILVSPWVQAGVWSEQLDHTSVGKYLCEKWGMKPLGKRMQEANSLQGAISTTLQPRRDLPVRLPRTSIESTEGRAFGADVMSENQIAMQALAEYLAPRSQADNPHEVMMMRAAASPEELREKAMRFLNEA